MFSKCVVLILSFSVAIGFTIRGDGTQSSRTKRDAPYRGPPAPLNHDGTVAFTQEFQQVNEYHNAAYAEEYQRLQAAEALAAAHPDRTSPPSKDYNPQDNGKYQDNGQYNHQDNRQFAPQQEDDGQYKPHLYENEQSSHYSSPAYVSHQPQVPYNQATQQLFTPVTFNAATHQSKAQHNQQQYSSAPKNPKFAPAPLNPDGTVAQTPEYLALAASLHNSIQQSLTRHRRSLNLYHGPSAPLNHDGTVANTPEIEHAIAVLKAAHAQAAAHHSGHQSYEEDDGEYKPHLYDNEDYRSHSEGHYDNSQYSQQLSHSFNPEAHIPAPLNHDGTVAHTAEYKAVAANHQAEYEKALHNDRNQIILPQTIHSQSYW